MVAKTAHDRKVVGSNPVVTGILDGISVKATQVRLMLPAGFLFLDASNDCQTARVSGRKKNLPMQESCYRLHILYHMFKLMTF